MNDDELLAIYLGVDYREHEDATYMSAHNLQRMLRAAIRTGQTDRTIENLAATLVFTTDTQEQAIEQAHVDSIQRKHTRITLVTWT